MVPSVAAVDGPPVPACPWRAPGLVAEEVPRGPCGPGTCLFLQNRDRLRILLLQLFSETVAECVGTAYWIQVPKLVVACPSAPARHRLHGSAVDRLPGGGGSDVSRRTEAHALWACRERRRVAGDGRHRDSVERPSSGSMEPTPASTNGWGRHGRTQPPMAAWCHLRTSKLPRPRPRRTRCVRQERA